MKKNCKNCVNCEKAPSHPNYKDAFGWCNAVVPFFANHKPLIKKKDFKECAAFKEVGK